MAYVRGNRADYDRWAASGLPGWSYADVLPYFRRQERWEGGADAWRGGDGPLTVETSRYQDPLVDAYLEAGRDAGYPSTADYNGAQQDGFGRMQMTIRQGYRCSAAVGYLRPALGRTNLRVETGALVTRILFEGTRAVGVEYLQSGAAESRACRARGDPGGRRRQLAADPDALRHRRSGRAASDTASTPRCRCAASARTCRTTPRLSSPMRAREPGPLRRNMRLDRLALSLGQGFAFGKGFTTSLPGGITAFLRSDAGENLPDVQLLFIAGPLFDAKPYLAPFVKPFNDGFGCRIVVLRPQARGTISLQVS